MNDAKTNLKCPRCGGELIVKSRLRLLLVGLCICIFIGFIVKRHWAAGLLLAPTAIYLLVWNILGKGRWCRNCKNFPIVKG